MRHAQPPASPLAAAAGRHAMHTGAGRSSMSQPHSWVHRQPLRLQPPPPPPAAAKQQPSEEDAAAGSWEDPRLKLARPEWLQAQRERQRQQQAARKPPLPAGSRSSTHTASTLSAAAAAKRRRMLDRLTYGGASSSGWAPEDSSDGEQPQQQQRAGAPGSSSSSLPQLPFQALGIDFGMQRVGVAVRHSSHNVPLFVLHRKMLAATSSTTSSSSSSIGPQPPEWVQADSRRIAAALLHHALQEGCDACVIGLPVFNTLAGVTGAAAASQATPKAAAGDAALLRAAGDRGLSRAIVAFARVLAAMAQPYQLPVLLVNEQQSSQQARAVMRGAAVYDVTTQQQLQQQLQQQQQAAQPASPPKQQQTGRPRHQGERDAYAAALILSRFYNGLVEAQEMLLPGPGQPGSNSPSRRTPRAVLSAAQLKQAAADLAQMQVLPTEQLRRHQQRQQSLATAAAARGSVVVEEDAAAE